MNDDHPYLASISLFVSDMAASLAFYRHLGIAVPEGAEAQIHVEVPMPNGVVLEFDTHELTRAYDPGWQQASGGSRCVFQFKLPSRAAVDALFAGDITTAGYTGHLPPFDAFWGSRYAVVTDPDGNLVALTSEPDPAMHGPVPPL